MSQTSYRAALPRGGCVVCQGTTCAHCTCLLVHLVPVHHNDHTSHVKHTMANSPLVIHPSLLPTGEEPKILIVKHWIVYVGPLFVTLVLGGFFAAIAFGLISLIDSDEWRWAIFSAWLALCAVQVLLQFLRWFREAMDIGAATNERLLLQIQETLLSNHLTVTPLTEIQAVKGKNTGLFGSLLRYGTLSIKTASETGESTLTSVPNSERLAIELLTLKDDMAALEAAGGGRPHAHAQASPTITGDAPAVPTPPADAQPTA